MKNVIGEFSSVMQYYGQKNTFEEEYYYQTDERAILEWAKDHVVWHPPFSNYN